MTESFNDYRTLLITSVDSIGYSLQKRIDIFIVKKIFGLADILILQFANVRKTKQRET